MKCRTIVETEELYNESGCIQLANAIRVFGDQKLSGNFFYVFLNIKLGVFISLVKSCMRDRILQVNNLQDCVIGNYAFPMGSLYMVLVRNGSGRCQQSSESASILKYGINLIESSKQAYFWNCYFIVTGTCNLFSCLLQHLLNTIVCACAQQLRIPIAI